jgi:uncharacterized membrane protein YfcA
MEQLLKGLNTVSLVSLFAAAFSSGIAKSGIPGLVTLITPLLALIMPAKQATGILLPILVLSDILAVIYWRRRARWPLILAILPWTIAGIAIGYFLMGLVDDAKFRPILGAIIVAITLLGILRARYDTKIKPDNRILAALIGLLAGISTMMANAAAPLLIMYFLGFGLEKEEFIGTNAWYFLIVNVAKLPFNFALGTTTLEFLALDALLTPLVVAGIAIGILIVKRMSQKTLTIVMQAMALIAGVRLLF